MRSRLATIAIAAVAATAVAVPAHAGLEVLGSGDDHHVDVPVPVRTTGSVDPGGPPSMAPPPSDDDVWACVWVDRTNVCVDDPIDGSIPLPL